MTTHQDEVTVIFRRFRRGPDGQLLDAWKYGYRAWRIEVPRNRRT